MAPGATLGWTQQWPWGLLPHKIQRPSTSLCWGGSGHRDWLPHSSTPPGWDQAQLLGCQLTCLCPSSQLSFTLLVHQKPVIKPLARGQSDNTAQRCSVGRKGLQGPPFPTQHPTLIIDVCQVGSASPPEPWSAGHAEGTAHPPLPSLGAVHTASRQTDKVHFTFPSSAGENCNKDKV